LIANPNCSTIQSVICLNALKPFGIKRVIYTTYQAVSGSGHKGIMALEKLINYYPYNIKETCIPQIDSFLDNGYTKEEMKMINETRKILNMPLLNITATCVRVPVVSSHAISVIVEFEEEFDLVDIFEAFNNQEGLIVLDNIEKNLYPTSINSMGNDNVYVGRIRKDLSNNKSLLFYCVADNIRKGAASNAVGIAIKIIEKSLSKGIALEN
jgi:aspartate-semialdehyde dehydrogenase